MQTGADKTFSNLGDKLVDKGADLVDDVKERGKKVIDDAAELAARGSEKLAGVSEQVRDTDVEGLLQSAKDCASRNPIMFAGIAAAAGFVLGRFMSGSGNRPG